MLFWKKKPKKKITNNSIPDDSTSLTPKPSQKSQSDVPPTTIGYSSKFEPEVKVKKQDHKKEFLKVFEQLAYRHRPWEVWGDFVVMYACALSNVIDNKHYGEREKRYLAIITKYSQEEQNLFPKLVAHVVLALEEDQEQDFLGDIFMELKLGNGKNGQFFTPYCVCDMMAKITASETTIKEIHKKGFLFINDPCCGAGVTLIAKINEVKRQLEKENMNFQNHLLVVAQDIDEVAALMCYIQISLLGVAGYVKVGNSLTDPVIKNDATENYWFTPMYFSDVWIARRMFQKMNELTKGDIDGNRKTQ